MEIAGRLRGGRGMFGWITALPWKEPVVLAQILALLLLTLGGFSGMVNASYGMNSMVHNTMWVPAHFHLIFAGTVITMYFAIAYHLWPKMTGNALYHAGMARLQLWLWFVGVAMLTLPWHYLGLLWMPRRTAYLPYAPEFVRQWQPWMDLMAVAGVIMVTSALLFIWNLLHTHGNRQPVVERELEFAEPLHPVLGLPKPLNGFALWNTIIVIYMIMGFGYPLLQFFLMEPHNALAWGW
jgi:cytochrome c oxidase subunit 1